MVTQRASELHRSEPTIACVLPGLDGCGDLRRPFANALASRFDVELVSFPSDEPLDYEALYTLVASRLQLGRRYWIIGESFSGPLACLLASRHSQQIDGLVLCATFASSPFPWLRRWADLARIAPIHQIPSTLLGRLLFGRWTSAALEQALQAVLREIPKPVLVSRLKAALCADARSTLSGLGMPTWVLRARQDRIISTGVTESLLNQHPQATQVHIDGPHALLQAVPEDCARIVCRALDAARE